MSENKPTPPNYVPEEDLSLHENFAPIIAENGLIRQPKTPDPEELLTATLTRMDTLEDLVQIRQAEKKEKTLPPQPVPPELEVASPNPEHSFAIANEEKPTLDLTQGEQVAAQSTSPWRGKMPDRADEGKSKTKNNLSKSNGTPSPGLWPPSPSRARRDSHFPLEGEDARRADEGESKTKNNLSKSNGTPSPGLWPPSPSRARRDSHFPLEGEDARRADEGESKTKNNLSNSNGIPSPGLAATLSLKGEEDHEGETLSATTTTLPAVIPATTTALMTTQKPKHRKSGLFKKRKKSKKQPLVSTRPPAQPPVAEPTSATRPAKRRGWWVLAVLLFLLLGSLTGLVPVEKIPLLRNVAYAMGFSKDDAARMSFLRALLAWADKTVGLPGNWGIDTANTSLFARRSTGGNAADLETSGANGLNARMTRSGGQTSLINMAALQKLQREKGRPQDGLRGAVMPAPGQAEAQAGPAQLIGDHVEVRTESTRVQGDVYFGSDAGAINRDVQDAYDSSKTLTKVKNPHIADGKPIDWLTSMAQKTVRATNSLSGLDRELGSTKVNWQSNVVDVGEKKEHKDLYHAWITSRMSKYTSNNMLKKSLADSSFLGAGIPTVASNVLTFGGIQVDAESFSRDQNEWKEYLEWEKQCKEDLRIGGGLMVDNSIKTFNGKFSTKGGTKKTTDYVGFPQSCADAENTGNQTFENNLNDIQNACRSAQSGYESLGHTCLMDVGFLGRAGQCDPKPINTLKGYRTDFKNECAECDTKTETTTDEHGNTITVPVDPVTCRAEVTAQWAGDGGKAKEMEGIVLAEIGGSTDYFPQIVKDQSTEDDFGYAHSTIVDGMGQNKNITKGD